MKISIQLLLKSTVSVFIILTLLNSCVKKNIDFDNLADQQLTPEIAVPLINSTFTIRDILKETDKNGNISIDPNDNFCTLIYKGNLFSVKGTDMISLSNQNFSSNYSLNAGNVTAVNLLPVGSTYSISFTNGSSYATSTASVQIDEITFKTGLLNLNVSSLIKQNAVLVISIPDAKKNGVALTQTISVAASTGTPKTAQVIIDLTDYKFDMTKGNTTTNAFDVNYKVILTKTANASTVGESISISQTFSNQAFSLIKGDIGQQSFVSGKDTVAISIFKNVVPGSGSFRIKYAIVKFIIENSYGVPININNLQLSPYTSGQVFSPTMVPLPVSYNPLSIAASTVIGTSAFTYPAPFGGPLETDLNNIINAHPKNFVYSVQTIANPNGAPAVGSRNFVTDASQFKVGMELSMPLEGGAWDFVIRDTMPFDLKGNSLENINSIMLRNYVDNGFPIDIGINIDFVDSAYVVKQTLNTGATYADVIPSAVVDANGKVTTSTQKTTDFLLEKAQLDNLKTVKYIIVRGKGNTTNALTKDVKIYADYKLNLRMGIKGDFNFTIKK